LALAILAIISLFVIAVYEENGNGDEILYHISKWVFIMIAYPVLAFSKFASKENYLWALVFGGSIGIIIDSLIIELVLVRYWNYRLTKSKSS
jgi:lipoprotein signal peptidase